MSYYVSVGIYYPKLSNKISCRKKVPIYVSRHEKTFVSSFFSLVAKMFSIKVYAFIKWKIQ